VWNKRPAHLHQNVVRQPGMELPVINFTVIPKDLLISRLITKLLVAHFLLKNKFLSNFGRDDIGVVTTPVITTVLFVDRELG
jgi:hypothetical protein